MLTGWKFRKLRYINRPLILSLISIANICVALSAPWPAGLFNLFNLTHIRTF